MTDGFWTRLPHWFMGLALLIAACAVVWQMIRGDALVCADGAIFHKICPVEAPENTTTENTLAIEQSDPFQLGRAPYTWTHGLEVTPAIAQVWSAPTRDGPWSLIDSIYTINSGGSSYGVWVHTVDDETLTLSPGNTSASSTYGATNHWNLYFGGRGGYRSDVVWFRVSVIYQR